MALVLDLASTHRLSSSRGRGRGASPRGTRHAALGLALALPLSDMIAAGCASRPVGDGNDVGVTDDDATTTEGDDEVPCDVDCDDWCGGWGSCVDGMCQCEDPCDDGECCGTVGPDGETIRCTGEPECWTDRDCPQGRYCDGWSCALPTPPESCAFNPPGVTAHGLGAGLLTTASIVRNEAAPGLDSGALWSDGTGIYNLSGECVWPESGCQDAEVLAMSRADLGNDGISEIRVWGRPDVTGGPRGLYFLREVGGALQAVASAFDVGTPIRTVFAGPADGAYAMAGEAGSSLLSYVSFDLGATELADVNAAVCVSRQGQSEVLIERNDGSLGPLGDTLFGDPYFGLEEWTDLVPHSVAAGDFGGQTYVSFVARRNGALTLVLTTLAEGWVAREHWAQFDVPLASQMTDLDDNGLPEVVSVFADGTVRIYAFGLDWPGACEQVLYEISPPQTGTVALEIANVDESPAPEVVIVDLTDALIAALHFG